MSPITIAGALARTDHATASSERRSVLEVSHGTERAADASQVEESGRPSEYEHDYCAPRMPHMRTESWLYREGLRLRKNCGLRRALRRCASGHGSVVISTE